MWETLVINGGTITVGIRHLSLSNNRGIALGPASAAVAGTQGSQ